MKKKNSLKKTGSKCAKTGSLTCERDFARRKEREGARSEGAKHSTSVGKKSEVRIVMNRFVFLGAPGVGKGSFTSILAPQLVRAASTAAVGSVNRMCPCVGFIIAAIVPVDFRAQDVCFLTLRGWQLSGWETW